MKKQHPYIVISLLIFTLFLEVRAQEEEFKLNIFGYTASKFAVYTKNNEPTLNDAGKVSNTFSMFQTGLFFSGNVSSDWKYLIEFQVQNDFTFQQLIGQNFIHQAWIEWKPSDKFGLRFGTTLAPFGNFNVIHSRPALYWIIERPLVYQEEELVGDIELLNSTYKCESCRLLEKKTSAGVRNPRTLRGR